MIEFLRAVISLLVGLTKYIVSNKLTKMFPPPERPIVEVRQGKLRGVTSTLPNGSICHYFKGIPYAQPPVGDLRFRPPVPIEQFYKPIVDCLVDRSVCVQPLGKLIIGKEAGLFMNIFSPGLPAAKGFNPKYPVMVWIHGGGFIGGSGDSFLYDPAYLIQEGVVVVTFNYRLGPLGFLSLPSVGIAGNAGLKDQLLVLKWVKEHIERFGGDPDNVTVFGESAGSMSAYLHYLSPNSRKYFHKVICQSGAACSESFFQRDGADKARKLASYFGYNGNDDSQVLETLLNAPAHLLIKHQNEVGTEHEKHLALQMFFRPVIEDIVSEDSIITESPEKILKSYDTLNMPIINGCTDGEGIIGIMLIKNRLKEFNRESDLLVPQLMGNLSDMERRILGQEIRQFYFGDKNIDKHSLNELCNVLSDNIFITNTNVSAEWISKYQPSVKQFHYRFCYDGRLSFSKKIFNLSHVAGASHGDDIFYIFRALPTPQLDESSEECYIRRIMVRMWTNFAKYSDPTPNIDDQLLPFSWTPVGSFDRRCDKFDLNSLNIDLRPRTVVNPCSERMFLWRDFLKKYRKDFL